MVTPIFFAISPTVINPGGIALYFVIYTHLLIVIINHYVRSRTSLFFENLVKDNISISLLFYLKLQFIFTFTPKFTEISKDNENERKSRIPSFLDLFLRSFVPLLAS